MIDPEAAEARPSDTPAVQRGPASCFSWNEALANHFFNSSNAGRPVFLFVTPDLIVELGSQAALPPETFANVVAGEPGSWKAGQVARSAVTACSRGHWRDRGLVVPPYLAHLSLFVLAAGTDEGDLAAHNYHSRLRRLIGVAGEGALVDFNRLGREVWHDLEVWSTQDMDGEFGVFTVRVYGAQEHIGIPRAQTLLAQEELDDLPGIFARAHLDPTAEPSEQALVRALHHHGSEFRMRTRRVLDKPRGDVLRTALIEVVRDELDSWDGRVPEVGGAMGTVYGSLRLCLELQEGAQIGRSSLRCSLPQDYPDSPLTLRSSDGQEFNCEELSSPWSTRLESESTPASAADLDWTEPLELIEVDLGWRIRMRGGVVRVFESGEALQLPGWVEVFRLDRERALLLAYSPGAAATVEAWGQTSCDSFKALSVGGAVPSGWRLARVQGIRDDSAVRGLGPSLAFSGHLTLRLVGGLKTGQGRKYFAFAPPRAYVEGGDGTELVTAAGLATTALSPGVFRLPDELPIGDRFDVSLVAHGETVARQSILLMGDVEWASPVNLRVDSFGEPATTGDPGICGSFCDRELVARAGGYSPPPALPVARKAVLIGRIPGQVVDWPEQELPQAWTPIWAIGPSLRHRKSKTLSFCGPGLDESNPERPSTRDRRYPDRAVKRWRKEIWVNRLRIEHPSSPRLAALWNDYLAAAKR